MADVNPFTNWLPDTTVTNGQGGPSRGPDPAITVDHVPSDDNACIAAGKVQCVDGSCAETLAECAALLEYDETIGYDPSPNILNEETGEYEDVAGDFIGESRLSDIYTALGGYDYLEMDFETWADEYGDEYSSYYGSIYEERQSLIEENLGLLGAELDLTKRQAELKAEYTRYQSTESLKDLYLDVESRIRAGGDFIDTGKTEKIAASAYDKVLDGFNFEADAQELDLEGDLINIQGRTTGYELDLNELVQNYQDNMWARIRHDRLSEYYGSGNGEGKVCANDSQPDHCGRCSDHPDYNTDVPCYVPCSDPNDPACADLEGNWQDAVNDDRPDDDSHDMDDYMDEDRDRDYWDDEAGRS